MQAVEHRPVAEGPLMGVAGAVAGVADIINARPAGINRNKQGHESQERLMKTNSIHRFTLVALASASLLISGCTSGTGAASHETADTRASVETDLAAPASQAQSGVPQQGQTLYPSPEVAAGALKDAVMARDRGTLIDIFGNEGKQLIFSGDRVQEDTTLKNFGQHLSEYSHVEQISDNSAILHLGQADWPFPIPIVKSPDGWFFDTIAGKDEILDRRIGEDELNAIAVCQAYVAAQKEYASRDRVGDGVIQYAQRIVSHPGSKDGLYWEVSPGEELSPLGPLVAEAQMDEYPVTRPTDSKVHAYKGYIFHILTAQGDSAPGGAMSYIVDGRMTKGFALIASPTAYGDSGIMTFIVGKDGTVYQKNLGDETREAVKAIKDFDPDKTWQEVKD
jgi:outer membrane murein-binding lipoprotein Lpp